MKATVAATPLKSEFSFPEGAEVVRVVYSLGRLTIYVATQTDTQEFAVNFPGVEAFRVMDERDLMEYWPECSTPNGWIFQIHEGGWLSQESERPGSLIVHMNRGLKEYLVTGPNECVSILSTCTPEFTMTPDGNK